MSAALPPFDMAAAIAGRLPSVHPELGPFGDLDDLKSAVELLGPLHDLNNGLPPDLRPGPCGGLTWTRQVMPALLWRKSQGFNEARLHDEAVGTWAGHKARLEATRKHASLLVKALDRLQPWEQKALSLGADIDLEALATKLKHIRTSAASSARESAIAATPHRFMHGSPKARLAWELLKLWSLAPSSPPPGREGPFAEFVQTIARFALGPKATERDRSMDSALRDALSLHNGRPTRTLPRAPYPLIGDSPHMGWNWTEAVGQKDG